MARIHPAQVPRRKPATLDTFLRLAVRALFPMHNEHRLARVFEILLRRRKISDGWVQRAELAKLWPETRTSDEEGRRRASGAITNGLDELREQIDVRLAWVVPHLSIQLESDPRRRATRYRLKIIRRAGPWDFDDSAAERETRGLRYRYGKSRTVFINAQIWAGRPGHRLVIDAVREPPDAQWEPPSHPTKFHRFRDRFFTEESDKRRREGKDELHPGELWGIKEVQATEGRESTLVRIVTTRIMFPDYLLLRSRLDAPFSVLSKNQTFREWLGLEPDPRDNFCAPRDALCVAVALVSPKPHPTIYLAKQRPRVIGAPGMWELSAAGAASSSQLHVIEEKPDLERQVQSVVLREIGVKFDTKAIEWLGFARSVPGGNSSVIALVETPLAPTQVENQFRIRRERDDVDQLLPVRLELAPAWLASLPITDRGEFLELGIALAAAKYGLATLG